MFRSHRLIGHVLLVLMLYIGLSPAGVAAAKDPPGEPTATLLVRGLQELQGSTIGPDGALYVTAPLAGNIWRVDPQTGARELFASGLPARIPGLFFIGSGVIDVAFLDGTAYALVTGVAPDLEGDDIVGIYRIDSPNSFTVIADLGAFSMANPPDTDFFVPTGFQYAMEPYQGGFVVTDGHHNRVLRVTLDGNVTEVIAFGNVVPTGIEISGDTVYMTQAGPIPHLPETGKVLSFTLTSPTATEVATGARMLVDVEFGPEGTLYALSQGTWKGPFEGTPARPNTGVLLQVNPNGTFSSIVRRLNQPTSLEFIGNTAYVVSLAGEVWKIDNIQAPSKDR